MSAATVANRLEMDSTGLASAADAALKAASRFWFLTTVLGQLIFAYYIAALYGGAVVRGDLAAWNKVVPNRYVPGDGLGNAAIAAHLFLAVLIIVGGALQIAPQVRALAPSFHRWNGRLYMLSAFGMSMTGLYMVWGRGTVGDLGQHLGVSLNAVLIMVFAAMALRHALAREFGTHRRWALRLFLAVGGVWFFRVGLMLWLFVNKGPVGFDPKTLQGPFLTFLSFAQYLLPLVVLEAYLRTKDRAGAPARFAMAASLVVLTLATGVGVALATMGMWLPRL